MSNNRELSEFADYLTVDDTTKNVGIGTTLKISAGGIFVGNTEIVRPDGTWGGPSSGLVGAQGAQGAQGFQGAVGAQGAQGAVGAQGAQGAQGYQGAAGSATITNNADDRVITGGSGSNLNGEENLTFNGSSLRINTTTSDAKLEVNNSASKINIATLKTTDGAGSVAGLGFMVGQTSAGREKAALYFQETNGGAHYTGDLVFALNNNSGSALQVSTSDERMRITSSGNVGIGTDNPGTKLDVRGRNWANGDIVVGEKGNAGRIKFARGADGSDSGSIGFAAADNNSVLSMNVGSGDGTLTFQTNSTERLRVRSDGVTVFGSGGAPYGSNTVSIHPDDGMVNFGMDGRDSFITGQNSCYIYSGSGSVGSILAGTLVLQSRSNLSRDIQFVTGATPTERLRINGSGAFGLSGANYGTSGQVLTSQGSSAAPQWATPSASAILQVKNAHKTDAELYTPNTTWTDITDLSVSITPSSTSNNVYITATVNAATNARAHFRILRGSTPIAVGDASSNRPQSFASDFQRASGPNIISASISWLDSPSTTSATTYKIQARMDGPGNLYINRSYDNLDTGSYGRTVCSIIVMEAIP